MTSAVRHQDPPRLTGTTLANRTGSPNMLARRRLTLLAMSIAQWMIMVDIIIVNTALASMQGAPRLRMTASQNGLWQPG